MGFLALFSLLAAAVLAVTANFEPDGPPPSDSTAIGELQMTVIVTPTVNADITANLPPTTTHVTAALPPDTVTIPRPFTPAPSFIYNSTNFAPPECVAKLSHCLPIKEGGSPCCPGLECAMVGRRMLMRVCVDQPQTRHSSLLEGAPPYRPTKDAKRGESPTASVEATRPTGSKTSARMTTSRAMLPSQAPGLPVPAEKPIWANGTLVNNATAGSPNATKVSTRRFTGTSRLKTPDYITKEVEYHPLSAFTTFIVPASIRSLPVSVLLTHSLKTPMPSRYSSDSRTLRSRPTSAVTARGVDVAKPTMTATTSTTCLTDSLHGTATAAPICAEAGKEWPTDKTITGSVKTIHARAVPTLKGNSSTEATVATDSPASLATETQKPRWAVLCNGMLPNTGPRPSFCSQVTTQRRTLVVKPTPPGATATLPRWTKRADSVDVAATTQFPSVTGLGSARPIIKTGNSTISSRVRTGPLAKVTKPSKAFPTSARPTITADVIIANSTKTETLPQFTISRISNVSKPSKPTPTPVTSWINSVISRVNSVKSDKATKTTALASEASGLVSTINFFKSAQTSKASSAISKISSAVNSATSARPTKQTLILSPESPTELPVQGRPPYIATSMATPAPHNPRALGGAPSPTPTPSTFLEQPIEDMWSKMGPHWSSKKFGPGFKNDTTSSV